ncbi:hypothetical protein [Paenibacillus sp. tmac-D7]|uniref:hypothetical protein n=1 Tax=Paenibacillus sp. tmac-D7 TaxID=2591462 RepID=UPI001143FB45|nr:hypothetical protein [Paenibacillus sp. tmac-D7]
MEVLFRNEKEREFYQSEKLLRKEYGELARAITKRLIHLKSFESVGAFLEKGLGKPHLLTGDYDKCIAVNISPNYRLILEPMYDTDTDFSKLNLYAVKVVTILEVKDYHGN